MCATPTFAHLQDEPTLSIRLLGGFQVAVGGAQLPADRWRRRRVADLLKLLALAPGHTLVRDEVMDLLWPDLAPDAAANNLRYTAHALRLALRPSSGSAPSVQAHGDRLVLAPGWRVMTDVAAFEEAADEARRSGSADDIEAALALYAGELLPEDRYADWAAARRAGLRAASLALLIDLARVREARGEPDAAIAALQQLVAAEPAHEPAHVALMRLYALTGWHSLALRQWARLEAGLRDELDAVPAPESRRLHLDILAGRFPPAVEDGPAEPHTVSPAPQHNLPVPLTSFIGRADERANLARLLIDSGDGPRLVTLTGLGGGGKTRLALAVAGDLAGRGAFRDGVWLVELAGLSDPALVPRAVAAALGVPEAPTCPLLATLAGALRGRELLLVLDNCEHLVAACAECCGALLAAAPGLHILATSRVVLGVPGENPWPVPPLSLPPAERPATPSALANSEAVQFFVDRARWRRPAFAVTEANAAAVAAICRRLDGIPLALKLAAARLAVLPVEQLAARLDDALAVLTDGPRLLPARHRTLRATLDWSHNLLAAEERAVLRRLAVFAGGFTLEAAEAVAAAEDLSPRAILPVLAGLLDQSLVAECEDESAGGDADVRYRMHEVVRQYARVRLAASGEEEAVRRRHAEYYVALAERLAADLFGARNRWALARLRRDFENLQAVFDWSLTRGETALRLRLVGTFWPYWDPHDYRGVVDRWIAGALDDEGVPAGVRARALMASSTIAEYRGEYASLGRYVAAGLPLSRAAGDRWCEALLLLGAAHIAFRAGDAGAAGALLDQSEALMRALDDDWGRGLVIGNRGLAALHQGDLARARALFETGVAVYRSVGDETFLAQALSFLGLALLHQGDYPGAEAAFVEGLSLFQRLRYHARIAECVEGLASVAWFRSRLVEAARLWGFVEAWREAVGAHGWPVDATLRAEHVADARRRIGEATFDAAWAEGRALTPEGAIGAALAVFGVPAASIPQRARDAGAALSPREREIAALLAEGRTNGQIAVQLNISPRTADTHVRNILKKLGVASRAVVAARLWGDPAASAATAEMT
jgi:predicted ATPase/DNA-binding SARP family transcriptional activator/DNA-binding CsgD family transcriptional regulator